MVLAYVSRGLVESHTLRSTSVIELAELLLHVAQVIIRCVGIVHPFVQNLTTSDFFSRFFYAFKKVGDSGGSL